MKLVFYFMDVLGKNVSFSTEEREAKVDRQDGRVFGYEFDMIGNHGRPFKYVQAGALGKVFEGTYNGVMLVIEEKDKGKAREMWTAYFANEIAKKNEEIQDLTEMMLSAELSNVL